MAFICAFIRRKKKLDELIDVRLSSSNIGQKYFYS